MSAGNVEKHFVLVHGACHGAWCWYKLKPLLQNAGHRVTALDMAACGINPTRIDEVQTLRDYCQPLIQFIASLPDDEKIILVGHSLGGLNLSTVMEMFPEKIEIAVFLAAFMPDHQHTPSFIFDKKSANHFEHDVKDLELVMMLKRPSSMFSHDIWKPETKLSKEKYGSVKRVYVTIHLSEREFSCLNQQYTENYNCHYIRKAYSIPTKPTTLFTSPKTRQLNSAFRDGNEKLTLFRTNGSIQLESGRSCSPQPLSAGFTPTSVNGS
ncbi:hypothetical protein KSS87_007824 [Heliosperma pusillum]|nr:hypothetical protein KSS87_007824 [Heliosperma pusillum]